MNVLGHMQQGGYPSPYDRNFGTKLATRAADWFLDVFKNSCGPSAFNTPETAVLLGLIGRHYRFTPVQNLKMQTDFK